MRKDSPGALKASETANMASPGAHILVNLQCKRNFVP